jgi:transcriptional regulator with XRE-family HTH domain
MLYATKLTQLRDAAGLTQRELAEKSGVSQQAIAHYEAGDRVPGFDAVQSICKALGVSIVEFERCTHGEPAKGRRK